MIWQKSHQVDVQVGGDSQCRCKRQGKKGDAGLKEGINCEQVEFAVAVAAKEIGAQGQSPHKGRGDNTDGENSGAEGEGEMFGPENFVE